eukprot:31445-Pelagococcus_subviridis.AAC.21
MAMNPKDTAKVIAAASFAAAASPSERRGGASRTGIESEGPWVERRAGKGPQGSAFTTPTRSYGDQCDVERTAPERGADSNRRRRRHRERQRQERKRRELQHREVRVQGDGAQVPRHDGRDLERPRLDHEHRESRPRERRERDDASPQPPPSDERPRPRLRRARGPRQQVRHPGDELKPPRRARRDRRAVEPQVRGVDERVVESDVDDVGDHRYPHRRRQHALRLHELHRDDEEVRAVPPRELRQRRVLADGEQQRRRRDAEEDADGNRQRGHHRARGLRPRAVRLEVSRAESRGEERVQRGEQAEHGEVEEVEHGVPESRAAEFFLAEAAHHGEVHERHRHAEEVRGDDRQRDAEHHAQLALPSLRRRGGRRRRRRRRRLRRRHPRPPPGAYESNAAVVDDVALFSRLRAADRFVGQSKGIAVKL